MAVVIVPGPTVVEGQESLHRMRMRAAAEAGDPDGVNAAFREAQRAAESYGFEEEVQPETQALYESLVGRAAIVDRSEGARASAMPPAGAGPPNGPKTTK
jgi:hypothetical protein